MEKPSLDNDNEFVLEAKLEDLICSKLPDIESVLRGIKSVAFVLFKKMLFFLTFASTRIITAHHLSRDVLVRKFTRDW